MLLGLGRRLAARNGEIAPGRLVFRTRAESGFERLDRSFVSAELIQLLPVKQIHFRAPSQPAASVAETLPAFAPPSQAKLCDR